MKTNKILVPLEPEDIALLREALDSHIYWQLSDSKYRRDGYVREPETDDEETGKAIEAAHGLDDILRKYEP